MKVISFWHMITISKLAHRQLQSFKEMVVHSGVLVAIDNIATQKRKFGNL